MEMHELDQDSVDPKELMQAIETIMDYVAKEHSPVKRFADKGPKEEIIVEKYPDVQVEKEAISEHGPIEEEQEYKSTGPAEYSEEESMMDEEEDSDLIPTEFLAPKRSVSVMIGKKGK